MICVAATAHWKSIPPCMWNEKFPIFILESMFENSQSMHVIQQASNAFASYKTEIFNIFVRNVCFSVPLDWLFNFVWWHFLFHSNEKSNGSCYELIHRTPSNAFFPSLQFHCCCCWRGCDTNCLIDKTNGMKFSRWKVGKFSWDTVHSINTKLIWMIFGYV